MSFYAYMLRCSDGSYYVGHSDNLDARIGAHQSGLLPGYTQKRRPVQLVWHQEFPERDQAFAAERQIKRVEPPEEGSFDQRRLGGRSTAVSKALPEVVLRYAAFGGYSG
jgi:predicted GIY-YIG superfamily endonuclease